MLELYWSKSSGACLTVPQAKFVLLLSFESGCYSSTPVFVRSLAPWRVMT